MFRSLIKFSFVFLAATAAPVLAEEAPKLTPEQILNKVTWPKDDFDASVFASPPDISYPIFLSAAPDGTLFVGCDPNGSLDQAPNLGKIIMCRDTDGDGKADKFTTFCNVDSPRGVAWDGSTRTLYVMHPPFLTAYHDDAGVGVANRQEDLISGLGFGLDFRGADHTINGCRLGIDGWIYIACGDYGAVLAKGKDGRSFELRGGGVVRIRPDGTGMELVIKGARNILSVALSPTMEIFTRDNTNDGDDWNDRLSYNPFGAQMGYPTLFRNFADEIIPTMIDFGGGSPVGSIFIDEPSLPKEWAHGFYSVEWGRSEIDLHPLTPDGATYKADSKQFMRMTRATDLEVDGKGNLYAASWEGATFKYNGPNVGYVIKLAPKGSKPLEAPDFKSLADAKLIAAIGSPSAVWRQAAQREVLVRGEKSTFVEGLESLAKADGNIGVRVAALYTLKQLRGAASTGFLLECLSNTNLREYALKVLGDDQRCAAQIPVAPLVAALSDENPRVRLQAVTALGHLGKIEAAGELLKRTADSDYTVAHIAVQALRWLSAKDVCLQALDAPDSTLHKGALRVLFSIYEPSVVDGLLSRLSLKNPELHFGILKALCRLATKEAPFSDPKMWWGTRPDTSGPLYKPERWEQSEKIEAALKTELESASGAAAQALVTEVMRTKVSFPGLTELMLSKAGNDTASRLDVIGKLLSPKTPAPQDVLKALGDISKSASEQPEIRVRALRMLLGVMEKNMPTVIDAFLPLAAQEQQGVLLVAWEEFTRDARLAKKAGDFVSLAKDSDAGKRTLGMTVLVNLVSSTVNKDQKSKDQATKAIGEFWKNSVQAASLLAAIGKTHATQFGAEVKAQLNNKDHVVAEAAEFALTKLGLDRAGAAASVLIGTVSYEEAVKGALAHKGDANVGKDYFLKQGCIACHTTSAAEPPKGPMLAGIATRYSRAELCESILKPSAKIAQGFESQYFKMNNGEEIEGFVVKEGGDSVEVRNIVGATTILEKGNIAKREKREKSIMPEGLVNNISPEDLSSLLAYLESLKSN
jgi:putative heme-binding domain-containing protein